jgi:WD40 repeat protein
VYLWDAKSGDTLRAITLGTDIVGGHRAMLYQIAFDGKRIAAGTIDGRVHVWDADGKPGEGWKGHAGRATAVALHGNLLASGGSDGVIRIRDATTGNLLSATSTLEQPVRGLSSDGKRLAVLLDHGEVTLFGLSATAPVVPLKEDARRAVFTAAGDLLTVHVNGGVWRWAGGKRTPFLDSTVRDAALSADGKVLATADDDGKMWIRSADGKPLRECQSREKRQMPVVSARGAYLTALTGAAAVALFDGRDGRQRKTLAGHRGGTMAAAFTADERMLVTGGRDKLLRFWDVDTGSARYAPRGQSGYVTAVAADADGRFIASGTADGAVQVRSARGGVLLHEGRGHRGPVSALLFVGGKLASGGMDTSVMLWDVSRLNVERPALLPLGEAEREGHWKALLDGDGAKASAAQEKLALGGEAVLALVRRDVRRVEAGQTARWVRDLDSDEYSVREAAYAGLRRCGPLVEGVLRRALRGKPSLDLTRRVERLLNDIAGGPTADTLRHLRSVEVLEMLGTPRAEYALLDLASGASDAELTDRARSALERLRRGR